MNDLQAIARAYYDGGSATNRALLHDFFNAMDGNRDGTIDYVEFKDFMTSRGYRYYVDRSMFMELATSRRGRLNFNDVMTLCYIIMSRRPFCEKCDQLVTGVYFACVGCFHRSRHPYCICIGCFRHKDYDFKHGSCRDRPEFWDNYAMLEAWRRNAVRQTTVGQTHPQSSSSTQLQPSSSQPPLPLPEHSRPRSRPHPRSSQLTRAQSSSSIASAEHSRRSSNMNRSPSSSAGHSCKATTQSSSSASSPQPSSSTQIVRSTSRTRMDNGNKSIAWDKLEQALRIGGTFVTIGVGVAACTIM